MSKPYAIAIATDAAQFPAALFLVDRLASRNSRDDVEIVLFSDSFNDLAMAQQWGAKAELRLLETRAVFPSSMGGQISGAAFYRFFLPQLTGATKKVLYLDVDTYAESDTIFRSFDIDMHGHAIAAVRDYMHVYAEAFALPIQDRAGQVVADFERTGNADKKYLNSGVLLIDVELYAQRNLEQLFLRAAIAERTTDQGAINRVLRGDWLELSPAFNAHPRFTTGRKMFAPVLTHFVGRTKPWHGPRFTYDHPVRKELEAFLLDTPWRKFLGQHFALADAWKAVNAQDTFRLVPNLGLTDEATRYVKETTFADVAQGIVERRS